MSNTSEPEVHLDVLVIGAGINGIYQLYRAREAGFTTALVDKAEGVGGTWFWNRYPGARFDSESYTYAYLFDEQLFRDWRWTEEFAGQPEIEAYLNHVVDRYELRDNIDLGTTVTDTVWDEDTGTWVVNTDKRRYRAKFVVAATGRLSVPIYPEVPGREDFRGGSYHTGEWPVDGVDFVGKRVAVIGSGSSGVQIIPSIVDDVAQLTSYQRTPNWAVPLNNRPITEEKQRSLRDNFTAMKQRLDVDNGGFLHEVNPKRTFDDPEDVRREFFEKMWKSPGFSKLTSNYRDITTNPEANEAWCEFMRQKIRSIVKDPVTAERLIPKNHGYAQKRPPFAPIGYYETFNSPKVSLVSLGETPILRITETGIETTEGHTEFDIIVWATGFDFGTGALTRLGIRGRDGERFNDHWHNGPNTFLGLQSVGFPNLFFPGGPHGSSGNAPRSAGDMVDFITQTLIFLRDNGYATIETKPESEKWWSDMIDEAAKNAPFTEVSYFYGTNVPGKPKRYLLNPMPRSHYHETLRTVLAGEYKDHFILTADARVNA